MTTIVPLDYVSSTDPNTGLDFGIRSGTVNLTQAIYMEPGRRKGFRVQRVILSSEIPNIYNYGSFTNRTLRITNDGGVSWVTIQLKIGVYTIIQLQEAIDNVANGLGWYTVPTDPAILLSYNSATSYIFTKLDSTKLAIGAQAGVDFGTNTKFYQLLGYNAGVGATFVVDGTHTCPNPPKLDAQSTYVEVFASCIEGCRYVNGRLSNAICRVPIVVSTGSPEIVFPSASTGIISPLIPASIPSVIQSFNVRFVNGNGDDLVLSFGNAILELIIEYLD